CLMPTPPPPISSLFPFTTLFRSKKPLKKSPPLNPCKLSFCPIFYEYRKPYSANKKFYSSFGVKFYRTKPLNKKRHENNLSYLLYLNHSFFLVNVHMLS